MEDFSTRLEKVLEYLKITPYKMAKDIGTSEAVISNARNGKNNPSYDLLSKILNFYKVLNADWLITGVGEMVKSDQKNDNTPDYSGTQTVSTVGESDRTPYAKTPKLHPKTVKKLHPTLHPTHESCRICEEKERIIHSMELTIDALLEANQQLKNRLEDHKGTDRKQVG